MSESELYRDTQSVLTCAVCACRYPATRRIGGERAEEPVCSERCRTVLTARLGAARAVEELSA